jgi:hypothetical protein
MYDGCFSRWSSPPLVIQGLPHTRQLDICLTSTHDMNQQLPDQQVQQDIYLAFKDTALVRHADARKLMQCRKVIGEVASSGNAQIQSLVINHTAEAVALTVHSLINGRCFDSVKKAHERFPALLEEHVASPDPEQGSSKGADTGSVASAVEEQQFMAEEQEEDVLEPLSHSRLQVPSLRPTYLPHFIQHRLLAKVQSLLEKACYDFAEMHFQDYMVEKRWDCVGDIELNVFTVLLVKHVSLLDPDKVAALPSPVKEIILFAANIRHKAVHREPVIAGELFEMLNTAEMLSSLLPNQDVFDMIKSLHEQTRQVVEAIDSEKMVLENTLKFTLRDIDRRRQELDAAEKAAVEDMIQADKQYQITATRDLEAALRQKILNKENENSTHALISDTDKEPEAVSWARLMLQKLTI